MLKYELKVYKNTTSELQSELSTIGGYFLKFIRKDLEKLKTGLFVKNDEGSQDGLQLAAFYFSFFSMLLIWLLRWSSWQLVSGAVLETFILAFFSKNQDFLKSIS